MSQITEESFQVVVFNLIDQQSKKEHYAVPIEQVREIRPLEAITPIPNTEPYIRGIMNLRGKIIPVVDVKQKIGLVSNNDANSKSSILVAEVDGTLTGLLIDQVDQVMRIQSKDVESMSGGLETISHIKGVAKVEGRLIVVLDIVKLLEGTRSVQ